MSTFISLFGLKKDKIRQTCILAPILYKGMPEALGIKNFKKGSPYSAGSNNHATLIHTHVGAPLTADTVLYLKDTPCKNIILFGSCGLIPNENSWDIGSLLAIHKSFNLESFSSMLLKTKLHNPVPSDEMLLKKFLLHSGPLVQKVNAASCGSLFLEQTFLSYFKKNNIIALDMECSAVFNAANSVHKKAIAFFFTTDILTKKSVFRNFSHQDKQKINKAKNLGLHIISEFSSKL